jgi:hypothetical protein
MTWSPADFTTDLIGWYRADLGANTSAVWKDQSTQGNDLTQATPANRFALTTGIAGIACYRNPTLSAMSWFDIPFSFDTQLHAWWCLFRTRSCPLRNQRPIASFGPTSTTLMHQYTPGISPNSHIHKVEAISSGNVLTTQLLGDSDLSLLICSSTSSGATFRLDGAQATTAAFTAGTVTGGRLFGRQDGLSIEGEVYEFGIIGRPMVAGEISNLETYIQSRIRPWPTFGQVVVIGDSIGEGADAVNSLGMFGLLDNDIGATYIQRSYCKEGQAASDFASFSSEFSTLFDTGLQQNIAICQAGTNDLGAGASAATAFISITTWLSAMRSAGFKTIAMTIAPRNDAAWDAGKEGQRLSLNSMLRVANISSGVSRTADITTLPAMADPNNPVYFSANKLHWADASFVAVEAFLKQSILGLVSPTTNFRNVKHRGRTQSVRSNRHMRRVN